MVQNYSVRWLLTELAAYYDNKLKWATTADGTVTYGTNLVRGAEGGTAQLRLESDEGDDDADKWRILANTDNHLYIQNYASGSYESSIKCEGNGSTMIHYDNSVRITTTNSGCTVAGTVNETSDIALKTNIEPIDNVLDKIQQITGYTYQFKDTGHNSMGVTAQEVEKVFPELVHGEEGTKTLQYSGLIGVLIESVKELSNKVAALESA